MNLEDKYLELLEKVSRLEGVVARLEKELAYALETRPPHYPQKVPEFEPWGPYEVPKIPIWPSSPNTFPYPGSPWPSSPNTHPWPSDNSGLPHNQPCLWDGVEPGKPMWMVCNCPKCQPRC